MKLPYKKDLVELIKFLKTTIREDYRSQYADEDETMPSMDVTIGANGEDREYGYQTGDNSFSGAAYVFPYWAVVTIDRRSNSGAVANAILDQLLEQPV